MAVSIVGQGRLGRSLAVLLEGRSVTVHRCGRGDPVPDADVTLLTVPDRAIAGAARALPRRDTPVLHCSGATDIDVLRPHRPAGSFHPLMTFPGPEVALPDLDGVAAALAGDPEAIEAGRHLAELLGMTPVEVAGDRRLYHAAAVIAGNFATVLLADAALVLAQAGVSPEDAPSMLAPLAIQSLRNAGSDPVGSLTGPAARGDHDVINGHRAALLEAGLTAQEAIYRTLTERAQTLLEGASNPSSGPPPDEV